VENARTRVYRIALRNQALELYGKTCACCGEHRYEFLDIHHVEGGGNKHRKSISGNKNFGGYLFLLWLKRNNWPSGFQVLCSNCNGADGFHGECPHQKEFRELSVLSLVGAC
jgi:hypothetical protein